MRTRALLIAAGLASTAVARPDEECCGHVQPESAARQVGTFDPATGKDLSQYPPDPQAEYQRMALRIDIADMNVPRMEIVQTLRFVPLGNPMTSLKLDARLFAIKSVAAALPSGQKTTHAHDGRVLEVKFDPPLPPGQPAEIMTSYTVEDPPFGITWTPESPAWPGRPAQLHSQGQAETNSYWFPCHDSPNARLSTDLVVTVPEGFVVSSNGKLVQKATLDESGARRTMYHWFQEKPHVNYLVSLVVGKFDIEDVGGRGSIAMPVYVPPGRGRDIKPTYGNTARMIGAFEKRTGQAYPWDQYAQLVVWNFSAGGMENTSATTMYDTAILSDAGRADGDLEGLISHELAHQWFGDLITCKSWEHIWLNEGFATYFTTLWWEERDGKDGYLAGAIGNFDRVIAADKADAPYQPAMVSKDFRDPGQAFRKAANPYPKGASILHMLRTRLGDEVFFRALAVYVERYKLKLVETNDFRRSLEEVSGASLEQFFAQWCYRPGVPELDIACEWKSGELSVTVEQKQNIDGYNPAFAFTLPVYAEIKAGAGAMKMGEIEVREKKTTAAFKMPSDPSMVAIDPGLSVLARMTIAQPMRRWLAQLERGPTLPAKVQAARALAGDSSSISAAALARIAAAPEAHRILRQSCITSLGYRKDAAALGGLSKAKIQDRDVRETLIETAAGVVAGDASSPEAARLRDMIVSIAGRDESERARGAALKALGTMKLKDRLALLAAGVEVESQHDRIRQGALEGLALLDEAGGLPLALKCAQPGTLNRTRPVAIEAAGRLAHHNPGMAVAALSKLLMDRERRAWQAAGEALAKIRDSTAAEALKQAQAARRDPGDKALFQRWIDSIRPLAAPAAPAWLPAAEGLRWYPIARPQDWVSTPEERAELEADLATFFLKRGYVVEQNQDSKGLYMLCEDRPEVRMIGAEGNWRVESVSVERVDGDHHIDIDLDDAGSKRLRDLTGGLVGRKLAVLVNDRVFTAPQIASPISKRAGTYGKFTAEEADTLKRALLEANRLSLRAAAEPGKVEDEPALRKRVQTAVFK